MMALARFLGGVLCGWLLVGAVLLLLAPAGLALSPAEFVVSLREVLGAAKFPRAQASVSSLVRGTMQELLATVR